MVVRKGEGLVLRLGDGRTFTVTVDDAEAGVRFIREQLQLPHGRPQRPEPEPGARVVQPPPVGQSGV